ncbi:HNH endonuclease [Arthrobacter phage DrSierra]|uniref:HNH endonuclease n=1 Tax=Arthrobacter phage DrSierra TaxID=2704034 RepID=A0A6G6XL76_9CAUD|nr:HNH endonuclease [Arthrobacter phage DrSierra]QIG58523.1 HNH endonuclease [Arthrobacter phage DrSierra]
MLFDDFEVLPHHRVTPATPTERFLDPIRVWDGEAMVAGSCLDCEGLFAVEELTKDRRAPGGYVLRCLPCKRVRNRAWTDASRDHIKAYRAEARKTGMQRRHMDAYTAKLAARSEDEVEAVRRFMHPFGTKQCRICREARPLGDFPRNVRTRDGLTPDCRDCNLGAQRRRATGHATAEWDERGLYACAYCGTPETVNEERVAALDVEHVVPRAHADLVDFDLDDPGNLVPGCPDCNRGAGGKFDRPVLDFVEALYPGLLDKIGHWPVEERFI